MSGWSDSDVRCNYWIVKMRVLNKTLFRRNMLICINMYYLPIVINLTKFWVLCIFRIWQRWKDSNHSCLIIAFPQRIVWRLDRKRKGNEGKWSQGLLRAHFKWGIRPLAPVYTCSLLASDFQVGKLKLRKFIQIMKTEWIQILVSLQDLWFLHLLCFLWRYELSGSARFSKEVILYCLAY